MSQSLPPATGFIPSEDADWLLFNSYWSDDSTTIPGPNEVLYLFGEPCERSFLLETNNSLFVLQEYPKVLQRVYSVATRNRGRGFIIRGNPGIGTPVQSRFLLYVIENLGKTLSLWYLLVHLVKRKETVLFSATKGTILFHGGQVYTIESQKLQEYHLPKMERGRILWSLIDMDRQASEPMLALVCPSVFPVQAASPNPIRYGNFWQKDRSPASCYLSLWTPFYLAQGLKLHNSFISFTEDLRNFLEGGIIPEDQDSRRAISTVANFIQAAHPKDIDSALNLLLDRAIYMYGHAPRDVVKAFIYPKLAASEHSSAIADITYEALSTIVSALNSPLPTTSQISHRIVAVTPDWSDQPQTELAESFSLRFKSPHIAKTAMEVMETRSHEQAFNFFWQCRHGVGASLAGQCFEKLAHRALANGRDFALFPMEKTPDSDSDSPMYAVASRKIPSFKTANKPEYIDLTATLRSESIRFERGVYYIPTAGNNPLFDAFMISPQNKLNPFSSPILYIFQITISPNHKGSKTGYVLIRDIMAAIDSERKQGKRGKLKKKLLVEYVLVCPPPSRTKDAVSVVDAEWKWKMPAGWNEGRSFHAHQGVVKCLILPNSSISA